MKKGILFLLIISAFTAKAQTQKQSLKDLLYSGKLKMDSNSVVRSTDDLSTKIDTSTKKAAEPEKAKAVAATAVDSSVKKANPVTDPAVAATTTSGSPTTTVSEPNEAMVVAPATAAAAAPAPVKSNAKILKEYSDSLVSTLKTEVLSSKKIKKETYYLTVDYEIDTNGQVTVTNVVSTPENSLLQNQVKERMLSTPPQLAPALDSSGNPRKVKRKYNFNITKE